VVQMSGYGANDYALRHHSGYLGSKAKNSVFSSTKKPEDLLLTYETLHRENVDFQVNNWLLDELPYFASLPIQSLTEIGCGNGRFALKAAIQFKQVTAVDWAISPVISEAIKSENLQYLVADVLLVPISKSDAIVSADFFEHLEEKDVIPLIEKIAKAAPFQFHKIACYPDSRGLHLTLQSPQAWLEQFQKIDPAFVMQKIEYRRNRQDQPVVTISRA
jgi:SAM-dependent methyltransferase